MKRFERAIKVLKDEQWRIIGKVAEDSVDKGLNPRYATRAVMAKNLKEAMDILQNHERNKFV